MALEYKVKNDIANMITQNEGTVFGGYVRDFILHEHFAKLFYSTHRSEDYENTSVSPETIDRLVIPNDIDCHFKNFEDYKKFTKNLLRSGYKFTSRNAKSLYTEEDDKIQHIKLVVNINQTESELLDKIVLPFFAKKVIKISTDKLNVDPVLLDVLIHSDLDPPFMGLDFECNGIIMDKDGIRLCKNLTSSLFPIGNYRNFQRIINDIHNKIAIAYTLKLDRWKKMIEKKWNVHGYTIQRNIKEGNTCILCHDKIDKFDNYNLICCSASYHEKCLLKMVNEFMLERNECCHCRQTCYFQDDTVLREKTS